MSEPQSFKTRFTTVWILIVIAVALVAWDLYAIHFPSASISEVVLGWARSHPIVPFSIGAVCGHVFWPQLVETLEGESK